MSLVSNQNGYKSHFKPKQVLLTDQAKKLIHSRISYLVLDLSRVTRVTGSFCGFLVSIFRKSRERSVKLSVIVPPQSQIYQTLCMAGIDKIIDTYQNAGKVLQR